MKFEHYLNKVLESEDYKSVKSKHPGIYLCTGFFVLDFEAGKDIHQLDFILKGKKVATFSLDDGVKMHVSELPISKKIPEIKGEIKTDIKALKGIVEDEMKNRTVTDSIKKIIALLQIIDNKIVWNLNCITDNMNVIQVHIDDSDQSVLKFTKYSIMDIVKQVPMQPKPVMPAQKEEAKSPEIKIENIPQAQEEPSE